MMGDLVEELERRVPSATPARARVWLWLELLRSMPPLLRLRIEGWTPGLRAVCSGLLAMIVYQVTVYATLRSVMPSGARPLADLPYLGFLALWLFGALAVAGYFASRGDRARVGWVMPAVAVLGTVWVVLALDDPIPSAGLGLWLVHAVAGTYFGDACHRVAFRQAEGGTR